MEQHGRGCQATATKRVAPGDYCVTAAPHDVTTLVPLTAQKIERAEPSKEVEPMSSASYHPNNFPLVSPSTAILPQTLHPFHTNVIKGNLLFCGHSSAYCSISSSGFSLSYGGFTDRNMQQVLRWHHKR